MVTATPNRLALCVYGALLLSSCQAAAPDCGSAEIQERVIKIFTSMDDPEEVAARVRMKFDENIRRVLSDDDYSDQFGLATHLMRKKYGDDFRRDPSATIAKINRFDSMPPDGTYKLSSIRLLDRNKTTNAVMCAATASLTAPNFGMAYETIKFKVETTTEGKPYVTVFRDGDALVPN